jgi:hypothetical protein
MKLSIVDLATIAPGTTKQAAASVSSIEEVNRAA